FGRYAHLWRNATKDGRLDKESVLQISFGDLMTTAEKSCAIFLLTDLDVTQDLVNRLLVDDRTDFDFFIQAVSDAELSRPFDNLVGEPFDDLLVDYNARCGCASLA